MVFKLPLLYVPVLPLRDGWVQDAGGWGGDAAGAVADWGGDAAGDIGDFAGDAIGAIGDFF